MGSSLFVYVKAERRIPDIRSSFVVSTIRIAFINNKYLVSINTCYCIQIRTKNHQYIKLISTTQTGFLQGRFIGESTRLIYDLIKYTEDNKMDGLLMSIDFEKAFDSISWKFMYLVLEKFEFTDHLIKWVRLFNTYINASVLQFGILSDFFQINRGCKQRDPLAPYLFLLCGQILYLLIESNKMIKGITIKNVEFKISQFADDTTLILDGNESSSTAALNTLEIFGSLSGLKMNSSKSKMIWIGRKKHSKDKLNCNVQFDWNNDCFSLLGLEFHVDLDKMDEINYNLALIKVKKTIAFWKNRSLTLLGKISNKNSYSVKTESPFHIYPFTSEPVL